MLSQESFMNRNAICFLLLCLLLYADISVIQATTRPTLLWKHTFPNKIVSCSHINNFTLENNGQLRFPLNAVNTKEQIVFLSTGGTISNSLSTTSYEHVCLSGSGNSFGNLLDGVFTIHDPQKKVQTQININAIPYSSEHFICKISPLGDWVCIISWFNQRISFYSGSGLLLASHQREDLKQSSIHFSKNNEWVAIHVPNWGQGNTSGYVELFNKNGQKQYTFYHRGCLANYDLTADGRWLAISDESQCYVLDQLGKVVFKTILPGISKPAISDDGKILAVASKVDHQVSLWNVQQNKQKWIKRMDGFDKINSSFTGIDVSGKAHRIVATERQHWSRKNLNSRLTVWNDLGEQLWQNNYSNSQVYPNLSDDGKCLMVYGDCDVYLMYWK